MNTEKLIHVESGATLTIKDTENSNVKIMNSTGPAIQNDGTLNLQISNDSGTVNNN